MYDQLLQYSEWNDLCESKHGFKRGRCCDFFYCRSQGVTANWAVSGQWEVIVPHCWLFPSRRGQQPCIWEVGLLLLMRTQRWASKNSCHVYFGGAKLWLVENKLLLNKENTYLYSATAKMGMKPVHRSAKPPRICLWQKAVLGSPHWQGCPSTPK